MKESTEEKALVQVNKKSVFYKIKILFNDLFNKNKYKTTTEDDFSKNEMERAIKKENTKESFVENIRNIENEETKLLKLQKQYRAGEIKEEDLTQEQYSSLCNLYDKQIENLKKSNQIRKQRLLEYRKNSKI